MGTHRVWSARWVANGRRTSACTLSYPGPTPMARCADSESVQFPHRVTTHPPACWLCATWPVFWIIPLFQWPFIPYQHHGMATAFDPLSWSRGSLVTCDFRGASATVANCPWGQWLRNGLRLRRPPQLTELAAGIIRFSVAALETPVVCPGCPEPYTPLWLLVNPRTWSVHPPAAVDCTCSCYVSILVPESW